MQVTRHWNPLALKHDPIVVDAQPGMTPAEVIESAGLRFTRPYILLLNGQPLSRVDWPVYRLSEQDICHFVELPAGGGGKGGSNPLQILAAIVVVAAASYVSGPVGAGWFGGGAFGAGAAKAAGLVVAVGGMALVNKFFASSIPTAPSLGTADTVYSINGGSNRLKIDSPFAEQFGRLKVYPDLAQIPYTEYTAKNEIKPLSEQYLYFSGFISVGEVEFERAYIGTTDVDNLDDVDYNILDPDTDPSIVTRLVWATNDISGHLLNHEPDDWSPARVALNPPNTQITHVGWDLEFPAGCYLLAGYGYAKSWVLVLVRVRMIDDDGDPITDWSVLTSGTWDGTLQGELGELVDESDMQMHYYCTIQPSRGSYYMPLPFGQGRYEFEISGYDTETNNTDVQVCNKCYCGQVRGYGGPVPDYGDVTRIEMSIRASSQISGAVADQISVVSTRKLYPVTSEGFGETLTATESIVDAAAYIATSDNGGRLSESSLDWSALSTLRSTLDTAGYTFAWRFESRLSVMEAITMAAKCGMAKPYLPGGLLTLVQDAAASVNTMIFTEHDYDEISFSVDHELQTESDPTGVRVKFIDGDKWTSAELDYYDDDGSGDNLATVSLDGVNNRQQAYDLAVWYYFSDKCGRSSISFTTGLKGHIPAPGARIGVVAPPVKGENCGVIQSIDGTDIYLSAAVDFDGEASALLTITDDGGILGPYTVTAGGSATHVIGSVAAGIKTMENDGPEAAKYIFGAPLPIKVDTIRPRGQNSVEINGRIYDADIYTNAGTVPSVPSMDLLEYIRLDYIGIDGSDYSYNLVWVGSAAKVKIELDEGGGYATEQDDYTLKYYSFTSSAASITVKVTPYDGVDLSTGDAITATHSAPVTATGLALDGSIGTTWTIVWDDVSADEYKVEIYDSADALMQTRYTTDLTMTWTEADMQSGGGPWESWTVYLYAMVDGEYGIPDTLACNPTALDAPSTFVIAAYIQPGGAVIEWSAVSGAAGYVLYSGATSDFDPEAAGTLEYSDTGLQATVTFSTGTYYKVAAQSLYLTDVGDLTFTESIIALIVGGELMLDDDDSIMLDDDDTFMYDG